MLVGEVEQIVGRGAGEGVDRLVGIAHDRDVGRLAQPQLEQALLERVGVLVFVDADPGLLVLHQARGVLVRLEEVDGEREHVLEVDPMRAFLGTLVAGVDTREEVRGDRGTVLRQGVFLPARGRDAADLGPLDRVGKVLGGREVVMAGQPLRERPDEGQLRFEDLRRVGAAVAAGPEVSELPDGVRVERACHHAAVAQGGHPLDHLVRRLVRERNEQDLVRRDRLRSRSRTPHGG